MTDRTVDVYLDGTPPTRVGRLFTRVRRGRESASFSYERSWLEAARSFAIDPEFLPLTPGTFHTPENAPLFPAIADSAPDRWGRNLMARQARIGGPRTLFESDYLLLVDDASRQGALRFRIEDGPFLAGGLPPIPPLVRLPELLAAAEEVERTEDAPDALRILLAPGSSLGGARPKASVVDSFGRLAIAKFPAATDDWPVIRWEAVCQDLARAAGVEVPPSQLVDLDGRAVLVSDRFDRSGARRVPFLSAMAMLGASDRDQGHSYLELADAVRRHGIRVEASLAQLYRRMAFNVAIANTDDHLRNHGFLHEAGGWRLSPAYDMNPVPADVRPRVHALALDDADSEPTFEVVSSVAGYFGLTRAEGRSVVAEVTAATSRWRAVALRFGLRRDQVDRMASAFEGAR